MAEEAPDTDEGEGSDESAKKGKSKLIIIIVAAVVLIAIIGGALAFLLGGGEEAPVKAATTEAAPKPKEVTLKESLGYLEFDPPFTLRFLDSSGKYQLLRLDFSFAFQPKSDYSKLLSKMPEMRHEVLSAMHNFTSDELATKEGRKKLKDALLIKMRQTAEPVFKGQGQIKFVLITFMVMQ